MPLTVSLVTVGSTGASCILPLKIGKNNPAAVTFHAIGTSAQAAIHDQVPELHGNTFS